MSSKNASKNASQPASQPAMKTVVFFNDKIDELIINPIADYNVRQLGVSTTESNGDDYTLLKLLQRSKPDGVTAQTGMGAIWRHNNEFFPDQDYFLYSTDQKDGILTKATPLGPVQWTCKLNQINIFNDEVIFIMISKMKPTDFQKATIADDDLPLPPEFRF